MASGMWLPRTLAILGLLLMLLGALDPLEGSVVILAGAAVAALGAHLVHSRYRVLLWWSLALIAAGIGAMFGMSTAGGVAHRDRLAWWGLLVALYPIGYVAGLAGAVLRLIEAFRRRAVAPAVH